MEKMKRGQAGVWDDGEGGSSGSGGVVDQMSDAGNIFASKTGTTKSYSF